jgi:hypothetical protein
LEQGETGGAESSAASQGHLGDPNSPPTAEQNACLALFDLGIDSKLRACDLVRLRVRDVCHGDRLSSRAIVLQQKTQRLVQFEIAPATREAVEKWIKSVSRWIIGPCARE